MEPSDGRAAVAWIRCVRAANYVGFAPSLPESALCARATARSCFVSCPSRGRAFCTSEAGGSSTQTTTRPDGEHKTRPLDRPNSDLDEVEPKPATDADISRKDVQKARGAVFGARLRDPIPGFQLIIQIFYCIEQWDANSPPPASRARCESNSRNSRRRPLTHSAICASHAPTTPQCACELPSLMPTSAAQAPPARVTVAAGALVIVALLHV